MNTEELVITLLMHKYRYYESNNPIISDYEYDMLERTYLATTPDPENWIGFDYRHPLANEALRRLKVKTK